MHAISIAGNDKSVIIHIDKSGISEERIKEAISCLQLMLGDDSHIQSVDSEEQNEIESLLNGLTEVDNNIVFEKIVKL